MIVAPIPQNEHERLTTLYSYHILDTLPEKDFEDITILAAEICHTPIACISIIDKDRQWLKSKQGLESQETPRDVSFCGHAINKPDEIMVVPDSRLDERFSDNPYVTGAPGIKFYAGVPLCTENGHALGTLCVIDTVPKQLTENQLRSLRSLANQIVCQLELRKKNRELALSRFALQEINEELERFAQVVAHDMQSPCNNFIHLSKQLKQADSGQLTDKGTAIANYMDQSALQLKGLINDILKYSQMLNFSQENINDFTFEQLMQELKIMLNMPSNFTQRYLGPNALISTSKAALLHIISNLCMNAFHYNDKEEGELSILFAEETDYYTFSVIDNGRGIHADDFAKIFEPIGSEIATDPQHKLGEGIGLATVKRLVNKLGGEIYVASEMGEGSTFQFRIAK